jgi:ATPase subunit of ABC transporter with duplicated ATPase domains
MIVGEEDPDEGEVSVPKKLTIGYFRQDVEEMKGPSILGEAIAGRGRAGHPRIKGNPNPQLYIAKYPAIAL